MAFDEEGLSTFVREELPALYNLSFRLCGNVYDAEILCQTAFSLTSSSLEKNRLYKTALNEWKKRFAKTKNSRDEKSTDLATWTLNALDPNDKIILVLHEIEKKTAAEIAGLIDANPKSVKSRLAHAREAFREKALHRPVARRL